jgi:hypothetical protein
VESTQLAEGPERPQIQFREVSHDDVAVIGFKEPRQAREQEIHAIAHGRIQPFSQETPRLARSTVL